MENGELHYPFSVIKLIFRFPFSNINCIQGDVKVSTGSLNLDKRAAVRNRHKIRKLKITDKNTVALAA